MGAVGRAANATVNVGGYFTTAGGVTPTFSESAALIADNYTAANKIFIARDNGVETFSIADGGANLITLQTASSVGSTIKGAASQTANLQEWQNSSGTVLSVVDASGNVGIGTASPKINLHIVANGATTGLGGTPADRGLALTGTINQNRIYMENTTRTKRTVTQS